VDIFGRNGKQLPRNSDAFHLLSLNYKFYLAFENSNCRNYITEKAYFNAMR
ncbi:Glycoprotein 3-alpha-L-fucosyltransferase A, partial [Taenia solium]